MIRSATERVLRRVWWSSGSGTSLLDAILAPLEGVFAAGVAIRNRGFDTGSRTTTQASIPVISIGNLAVGGTGKTPFAGWIVQRLTELGARPAVITSGYGRDEEELHRFWNPDVLVVADADRPRGVERAAGDGADVAVLDDGFQHRQLARDLDIVLISVEHPTPVRLLPRGPYRERESALGRADAIVLTRRTATEEEAVRRAGALDGGEAANLVRVRMEPAGWRNLAGEGVEAPSGDVLAVSSVAVPEEFHRLVERAGPSLRVERVVFRDHHAYSAKDLAAIGRRAGTRAVVTTEKDGVKLKVLGGLGVDVRILRLAVHVESGRDWLEAALARVMEKGRGPTTPVDEAGLP